MTISKEEKPKLIEILDITKTKMYKEAPEELKKGVMIILLQRKLNELIDVVNLLNNQPEGKKKN